MPARRDICPISRCDDSTRADLNHHRRGELQRLDQVALAREQCMPLPQDVALTERDDIAVLDIDVGGREGRMRGDEGHVEVGGELAGQLEIGRLLRVHEADQDHRHQQQRRPLSWVEGRSV